MSSTGSFGALLRSLRERAGLTQQELAEAAGLTTHAVSSLERGTRTRPYPHTVRSLAGALEVSDDDRERLFAAVPRRGVAPQDTAGDTAGDVTEDKADPAALAEPTTAGPLLVPPTPLYGRDDDIAAVSDLFAAGNRLVTLTGPGGVGKTRLAAAVADAAQATHPDGVVRISLAPLADSAQVVPAIARALGIGRGDGPEVFDAIVAQVAPQRLLLVLDNFEHLLSAALPVARLLARTPHLGLLVTSRSPLHVRGEREYAVAPLSVPDPAPASITELRASAAGALVADHLEAANAHPTEDDVRASAQLCHRLAGLPLAIELAASQLRTLTPLALLERLDEAGTISGSRDLPARQRTMRATLDWSYGLLAPEEQELFTLLSVFRGGATLSAIEAVAGPASVLDLLTGLVEHSLVVVRPDRWGRPRFVLLEPVAQYARSLLVGDRGRAAVAAHARHYEELVRAAADGFEGPEQVLWLARVEDDEANALVAIERSLDGGDPERAARMAWFLWLYWWLRGQVVQGRRLAEACLAHDLPVWERARAHLAAATMSYAGGDVPAATHHWEESDRLAQDSLDIDVLAKTRAGVGLTALAAGDLDRAQECFEAALDQPGGDRPSWIASLTHVWLGTVRMLRGDAEGAVEHAERGLEMSRARGDRLATYIALYNLAQAELALDRDEEARARVEEGISHSREVRDLANLAYFVETLAVIESRAGRFARVAGLLGAAEGLRAVVGVDVYGYYLPDEELRLAAERRARDALGDLAYDELAASGHALDPDEIIDRALDRTGFVG